MGALSFPIESTAQAHYFLGFRDVSHFGDEIADKQIEIRPGFSYLQGAPDFCPHIQT